MSGALCAASIGAAKIVVPLSTTVSLQPGGATTYNVSTASGNLTSLPGAVQISIQNTGGSGTYTGGSASLNVVAGSAGASAFITNTGIPNNTVGWTGLNSPGNWVRFTISNSTTDSDGNSASDTFPDSGSVLIQRV